MIIDAHTHIHPEISGFGEFYNASLENLISLLKKTEIDKVVLLPFYPEVSNEFIKNAFDKYPEKIIPFASLNPLDKNSPKKLNYLVKKLKFKGLKIHPRKQKFELSDKRIFPIFKEAENLKIPVTIDVFPWDAPISLEGIMPIHIDRIAKSFPDLKILIAHSGGLKFEDAFLVAKANRNVFLEISFTISVIKNSPYEKQFFFLLKKLGYQKIIYGSDHPFKDLKKTYFETVKTLNKYKFQDKEKEYIFGKNFLMLYE
jgi:predicted TIM-barrel fold metal-dependent hydrolase